MRLSIAALFFASASLLAGRSANADCAPSCDYLLCSGTQAEQGLVRATIHSVSPGEYPSNPAYDAIEVEVTSMETATGNSDWVGQRFAFRQNGWLETSEGDEIGFWAPNQMQAGASLRPDIFLISNDEIVCEGEGVASIAGVADASDEEACLAAFSQRPTFSCDDTSSFGCSAASVGGSGSRSLWWILAFGLVACGLRTRKRAPRASAR